MTYYIVTIGERLVPKFFSELQYDSGDKQHILIQSLKVAGGVGGEATKKTKRENHNRLHITWIRL